METQRIQLISELPTSLRACRTSHKEKEGIKEQNLLQTDLFKKSYSFYSVPISLVLKGRRGEKIRFCVDFCKLNLITKTDAEPLTRIDTLLNKLAKAKFFSTMDFESGFWHLSICTKDEERLAFAAIFGLLEWLVFPFAFKITFAIFNRIIRRILNEYEIDFVCSHLNDIVMTN